MRQILVVHQSEVGRVLGKRGATINDFREKFGVKIKMCPEVGPDSQLVPVEIEGLPTSDGDKDVLCKQAIIQYLQTFENPYTGNRDEIIVAKEVNKPFVKPIVPSPVAAEVTVKQSNGVVPSTASTQREYPSNVQSFSTNSICGSQERSSASTIIHVKDVGLDRGSLMEPPLTDDGFKSCDVRSSCEKEPPRNASSFSPPQTISSFESNEWTQETSKPLLNDSFGQSCKSPVKDVSESSYSGWGVGFGQSSSSKGGFDTCREREEETKWSGLGDSDDEFGHEFPRAGRLSEAADTGKGLARTGGFQSLLQGMRNMKVIDPQDMPPIVKDFYQEHGEVSRMGDLAIKRIMKIKNDVQVTDLKPDSNRCPPRIITKFEHALAPYTDLLDEVKRNNFEEPSPIQCQMWPVVLSGYDCIGIAQTGTGKTLAFLFPAFIHIEKQAIPRKERTGATVLVLSPTRELAQQIDREVRKYNYRDIRSVCLYGGGSRSYQCDALIDGVDIVIATPGRMNDLINGGELSLDFFSYVVLDEADRMLDMGFEPQIRHALSTVRCDRHTVMTSATWPPGVQDLALKYMKDPFLVSIGSLDLKACHNVTQNILVVQESEKTQLLLTILEQRDRTDKYLIFCATKRKVDDVSYFLHKRSHDNRKMHGDVMQSERERAIRHLKKGETKIVVATDVAARGLDIVDITHVINYDMAGNNDDYVHRIGRTGRAGKTGTAVTFFTSSDWAKASKIIEVLEEAKQVVPPELRSMASLNETRESFSGSAPSQFRSKAKVDSIGRGRSPPRGIYDPVTGERIGTRI